MKAAKAQIVSFHCVLKNVVGQVISTSFNQDVITQGRGNCEVPGLPAGLKKVKPGERRKIAVTAKEAYGLYDPELARQTTRKNLMTAGELAVGDRMHLPGPDGNLRPYCVTRIQGDVIDLDANHPLAGQDLVFEVHVVEARNATREEILESGNPQTRPYLQ